MTLPQLTLVLSLFGVLCGYILFVLVRAQVRRLPGSLQRPMCVWCRIRPATKQMIAGQGLCDKCDSVMLMGGGREE